MQIATDSSRPAAAPLFGLTWPKVTATRHGFAMVPNRAIGSSKCKTFWSLGLDFAQTFRTFRNQFGQTSHVEWYALTFNEHG